MRALFKRFWSLIALTPNEHVYIEAQKWSDHSKRAA